jgi:hypothetical protein
VIAVDSRMPMFAAGPAANIGCAFDFDSDVEVEFLGGAVQGPVNFGA